MKTFPPILLACTLLTMTWLRAQTAPQVPAIPHPPANAHWIITFTNEGEPTQQDDKTPPSPQVRSAEYEVSAPTARLTERFDSGRTTVTYVEDHFQMFYDNQLKGVVLLDWNKLVAPLKQDRFTEVYPGFEWVSARTFVDFKKNGGDVWAHFQKIQPIYAALPDGGAGKQVSQIVHDAWISTQTDLPVAFRIGGRTGQYNFLDSPSAPIELPPDFAAALAHQRTHLVPPGQAASLRYGAEAKSGP